MINTLNENNFDTMVQDGMKLVAFTAPWCGYWSRQKPILEELSKENIWVGDVNGDENPHLTTRFSIQAFPAFILFKDGKPVKSFLGLHSKNELMNKIGSSFEH